MKNDTQKILEEIIKLDPTLASQKTELKSAIEALAETRPEAEPDEKFIKNLRKKVLKNRASTSSKNSFLNLPNMKKIGIFATGLAVAALVVAPVAYNYGQQNISLVATADASQIITPLASNAFGELEIENTVADEAIAPVGNAAGGGGMLAKNSNTASNLKVARNTLSLEETKPPITLEIATEDGTREVAIETITEIPEEDELEMKISSDYYFPDYLTEYQFVYAGQPITLTDSNVNVFRRVEDNRLQASASKILGTLDLGLIDLKEFSDVQINSLSFMENHEYGYEIWIDFAGNNISLSKNWQKWPDVYARCYSVDNDWEASDRCYESLNFEPEDVLSDAELISIAEKFLAEKNIDVSAYGDPIVNDYWQQDYERSLAEGYDSWVPDTLDVIFPLEINGEEVATEWGDVSGLNVSVDMREQKVSGVYGLSGQKFESSEYPAITNFDRVLNYIDRSEGRTPVWYLEDENQPEIRTTTVTLGTPEKVLMQTWSSSYDFSEEIFVPALAFPVQSVDGTGDDYYNDEIVVPIVTEILEERESWLIDDMPVPIPLLEDSMIQPREIETEEAVG